MNRIIDKLPLVSVIMPVRNEEDFISRSLGAVLAQDFPRDRMEVIIADGMSDDRTLEIIESMRDESSIPIRIVANPDKVAPAALNRAIARSSGEIIVRVDGHCEIAPDYVAKCVKFLSSGEVDGVGGPIETIGESLRARAIAAAMSSKFGVGGSSFRTIDDREMYVDSVAFPGYTRRILEKAGPFNEELVRNQDDEYNYRIRKLGGKILLSPEIRSRYYSRSGFKALWRQYFQYGYWKVRVFQLHPRQMSPRQFVPPAFVLTLMILAISGIFIAAAAWIFAGVLILYLIANLGAALSLSKTVEFRAIPFVSFSFLILHVSYGLGFLIGLGAFHDGWNRSAYLVRQESGE